jgi:hypothetical protein
VEKKIKNKNKERKAEREKHYQKAGRRTKKVSRLVDENIKTREECN